MAAQTLAQNIEGEDGEGDRSRWIEDEAEFVHVDLGPVLSEQRGPVQTGVQKLRREVIDLDPLMRQEDAQDAHLADKQHHFAHIETEVDNQFRKDRRHIITL